MPRCLHDLEAELREVTVNASMPSRLGGRVTTIGMNERETVGCRAASMADLWSMFPCRLQMIAVVFTSFAVVGVCGNGMSVRPYKGIPSIQELVCSGEALSPEINLLGMALYTLRGNKVVANLNVKDNECLTSETETYTSCVIDRSDSSRTRLTTLVLDVPEEDTLPLEALGGSNSSCFRSARKTARAVTVSAWQFAMMAAVHLGRMLPTLCVFIVVKFVAVGGNGNVLNSFFGGGALRWLCECGVRDVTAVSLPRGDGKMLFLRLMAIFALSAVCSGSRHGLLTRLFKGMPSIQEVECSGESIGSDMVGITLFTARDNRVIAYFDADDEKCFTSSFYSACLTDGRERHRTKLVTLVADVSDSEPRLYGCNVSIFRAGRPGVVSWSVKVQLNRMQLSFSSSFEAENETVWKVVFAITAAALRSKPSNILLLMLDVVILTTRAEKSG
ncbi:hypothetical protein BaRGS_00019874 [Batillaria attramentaria]|uniref:Uncharacterized protein n=1 Tax=Batillaria attramentaria TaxID=370345 RepID=A0ABD0KP62_9CAEN